jgi:hypothetical protein
VYLGSIHTHVLLTIFIYFSCEAVLYAAGNNKWELYGIVVVCTVVSCFMATIINNFSEKRQYPTYWGPLIDRLANSVRKTMGGGKVA